MATLNQVISTPRPENTIQRYAGILLYMTGALSFVAPLLTRLLIGEAFYATGRGKWENFDRTAAIRRTRRLDQLSDADFRKIQAVYLGMISYSDWLLGEVLEAVERTGHANDTSVFLFSDHGEWAAIMV